MTSMIRYQNPVEVAFNKYKNLVVSEENGQVTNKKLGTDDTAIEANEYKYALNDLYNKFYGKKSDEVYTKWMQRCGTINEPIKDAKTFGKMVIEAFEQLKNIAK